MSKLKKVLLMGTAYVLVAALAIGGTIAYLTDTDSDVNVITMGNVSIAQHEYQRVQNTDGTYKTDTIDNQTSYVLEDFEQGKALLPATDPTNNGAGSWDNTTVRMSQVDSYGGMQVFANPNAQDKFVTVENTGKTDAYVRTLVAIECGDGDASLIGASFHNAWTSNAIGKITVDGNNYYVFEYMYKGAKLSDGSWRHGNGILPAGDTSYPNLSQVYLKSAATNEDCEALDGNDNGTLDILVLSQAAQTAGFADAQTALDTAFGKPSEKAAEWFGGVLDENSGIPKDAVAVSSFEQLKNALAEGSNIKLTANISVPETMNVSESAAIYGQGHTITRADGYTGTVFSVKTDSNLTVENLTLDGSGATATGNLIATEGNGSIVLNAGTVIQNNNGAHAISLATRGGGSLTLNGAQVLNNSSDSGAIWAGGDVIVNEGSKISNNSSTGLAGAIRMVAGSAFTMNGGEISNNTAATDGGAIWGYNASGYYFNGGSIENNSAQGTGGAIYPGQGSQFYISDDFVMTNNTATDSGAIRFTSGCQLHMSGGEISGNISSDSGTNYSYNATTNITGGVFADNMTISGWVGSTTIGNSFKGILKLEMTHKNVQLTNNFYGIKFEIINVETTYADYKFIPAEGYTYTEGDETKLICMNDGYEVYWDANSNTFKLQHTN